MTVSAQDLLVDLAVERVLNAVHVSGPGQCIRIDDLPASVMAAVCLRVTAELSSPDQAYLLSQAPTESHEKTATFIVERRNLEEGVLVVFVPPNELHAVEDSFNEATFKVLDMRDLGEGTYDSALRRLKGNHPELAEVAKSIGDLARSLDVADVGYSDLIDFVIEVDEAANSDPEDVKKAVGNALANLGLLPDGQIGATDLSDRERKRRMHLNAVQVQDLLEPTDPRLRVAHMPVGGDNADEVRAEFLEILEDRPENAKDLAGQVRKRSELVDFDVWGLSKDGESEVKEFSVSRLIGQFAPIEAGEQRTIDRTKASIGVEYKCQPPLIHFPDSKILLEVLQHVDSGAGSEAIGVEKRKSSPSTRTAKGTFKRTLHFGEEDGQIGQGLYKFRLSLIGSSGETLAEDESEYFRVGDVTSPKGEEEAVGSVFEAVVASVNAGNEASHPNLIAQFDESADASLTYLSGLKIVFPAGKKKVARIIEVTTRLAEMESTLLGDPRGTRALSLDLDEDEPEFHIVPFSHSLNELEPYLDVREEVLQHLSTANPAIERVTGAEFSPNCLLADILQARVVIQSYVNLWSDLVVRSQGRVLEELLTTDRLIVESEGETQAVLLAPTHPIRLAWILELAVAAEAWLQESRNLDREDLEAEAEELKEVLPNVQGGDLPLVVTHGGKFLRFRCNLNGHWGMWTSGDSPTRDQIESDLLDWLDVSKKDLRPQGEKEIQKRIDAYLGSHPYVDTLVLNAVHPGEGASIVKILARIVDEYERPMRFIVRLFGDRSDPTFGSALDDLMSDPSGSHPGSRKAINRLSRASTDPLRPTFSFSKHETADLVRAPGRYGAHVTLFLDFFKTDVVPVHVGWSSRSVFGNGLLCSPIDDFDIGDSHSSGTPRWRTYLAVDPNSSRTVERALGAHTYGVTARSGDLDPSAVIGISLALEPADRALLDAVHQSSDWVIIVDPIFSDDYFDSARSGEAEDTESFVVDSRRARDFGESHNIVISTRMRSEQAAPMMKVANRTFDLELSDSEGQILLRGLHLLGAGLGLRLLMKGPKVPEAVSLALASHFLSKEGFLKHALLVPLDEYPDLVDDAYLRGEISSLQRSDLMVVRLDPASRTIMVTVIEVKVRTGLDGQLPDELTDKMIAQLSNSVISVRNRLFGHPLRDRHGSLAAALKLRRLTALLRERLERARRYEFLDESESRELVDFVESLASGYKLSVVPRGLVFDPAGADRFSEEKSGVTIDVLGADAIRSVLGTSGRFPTPPILQGDYMRTVFGATGHEIEFEPLVTEEEQGPAEADDEPIPSEEDEETQEEPSDDPEGTFESGSVDVIGHGPGNSQLSIVATQQGSTGQDIALDLGGTNVLSVFGVQGSGKSYGLGSIIESGLIRKPNLGKLPRPLATAVFHYSKDANYVSEYGSMAHPTDNEEDWFRERGIDSSAELDVIVLVPKNQLDDRTPDYPGCEVRELALAPSELTISDWKLLMGIEGGNQMYAKSMQQVLQGLGADFDLGELRSGIETARMSETQRQIAQFRLDFVERYLDDGAPVSETMAAGRLVIVDIRDPHIEQTEALALFMVLLNRFAETGRDGGGTSFNKMIVFDEAHKYMKATNLSNAIEEAVREMRHKGVTLVIASQDPPSLPPVVIELSTVVIAHKMTSPNWVRHLQRYNGDFDAILPGRFAGLEPGEAFLWSTGGARLYRSPQRVKIRPRLTKHGGETVRTDE